MILSLNRLFKITFFVLFVLWSLLPTSSALADIAPPAGPPGVNPGPNNETTRVRMVAETVILNIDKTNSEDDLGEAKVSANFTMRNLGSTSETILVRFPLSSNDGFYNYPEIRNLDVFVDGKFKQTTRISIPDPNDNNYPIPWAQFKVTFNPDEDVAILVKYNLIATGEYPFITFSYLLETGAGWFGTIGTADLIVQLPYEANAYNVFIDSGPGWGDTSLGAILKGNEISWHYDDFEPTIAHNLVVSLVMPFAWEKVLTERQNISNNPEDGEAWGRLGKAYKEISQLRKETRYDDGGQELFHLSMEAYEKALNILPGDALWHAGYADLLFFHYFWLEFQTQGYPGMVKAVEEVAIAYEINPNSSFILDLLEEMAYSMPYALQKQGSGEYVFYWLTATPLPPTEIMPSMTPTTTQSPTTTMVAPTTTATLMPTASATLIKPSMTPIPPSPMPTIEEQNKTPASGPPTFCGTALLFPLAVIFSLLRFQFLIFRKR